MVTGRIRITGRVWHSPGQWLHIRARCMWYCQALKAIYLCNLHIHPCCHGDSLYYQASFIHPAADGFTSAPGEPMRVFSGALGDGAPARWGNVKSWLATCKLFLHGRKRLFFLPIFFMQHWGLPGCTACILYCVMFVNSLNVLKKSNVFCYFYPKTDF